MPLPLMASRNISDLKRTHVRWDAGRERWKTLALARTTTPSSSNDAASTVPALVDYLSDMYPDNRGSRYYSHRRNGTKARLGRRIVEE
jgi:hypothetical protein